MTEIPNQSFRMPGSDAKNYIEQASALMRSGRVQEAIPLFETALSSLERTYGVDQPETAECLQELGEAYEGGNRLTDALVIHTRLLHMGERILGKTNPNVVAMLFKLTQINEMLGRPNDALDFCEQALSSARQCLAEDDPLSQHIIERHRFLSAHVQSLGQNQPPMQSEMQSNMEQPDWQQTEAGPAAEHQSIEAQMPANMQDFARQMLMEMPGSPRPFCQVVNPTDSSPANNYLPDTGPEPYSRAPNMVPAVRNTNLSPSPSPSPNPNQNQNQNQNQNNDYKAVLEAGFSAAQNHTSRGPLPHDPYAGVSGTAPPPPPAYEPGGEGYSMSDLNDIRSGRRDTGESDKEYTELRGIRPRRITEEDSNRIRMARLAKDFALPAVGLMVVISLLIFVLLSNKGASEKAAIVAQDPAKTASFGLYRTCDGDKEIRLVSGSQALLISPGSAIEVPYALISTTLGDLFSAMTSSVCEKQIWAEKKDFGLKTQDEIVYYTTDGAEAKVVAKMRRLAGYAQAYFLRRGEYPRYVLPAMAGEFGFVNPIDGRGSPIPIKTLLSQTSDGIDARGGLESGLEAGLAPNAEPTLAGTIPCGITCYAVVVAKPDDLNLDQLRATKFFIRGCDRNGNFLSSGQSGRSYVLTAADGYLSLIPAGAGYDALARPSATAHSKTAAKARVKTKNKAANKGQSDSITTNNAGSDGSDTSAAKAAKTAPPLPAVRAEKPGKNTKLWLIVSPAYPMLLIHHSLPLVFLALAVLAYLQSRFIHIEATGTSVSSTSNSRSHYAKIAAMVLLALAGLTILVQFVIFA